VHALGGELFARYRDGRRMRRMRRGRIRVVMNQSVGFHVTANARPFRVDELMVMMRDSGLDARPPHHSARTDISGWTRRSRFWPTSSNGSVITRSLPALLGNGREPGGNRGWSSA
jgi:hypothetical protein